MGREIIFRGKRLDTGEFIYGDLARTTPDQYFICFFIDDHTWPLDGGKRFKKFEVDVKTIGQYTGLKDINQIKIFEGDILENWSSVNCVVEFGWARDPEVYGNAYGWYLRPLADEDGYISDSVIIHSMAELKMIGNIYENPELIRGNV